MLRAAALASSFLLLAGCAGKEEPIGYTPRSSAEAGRSESPPRGAGGYAFGQSPDAVRARCAAERGQLDHAGSVSTCTTEHAEIGATHVTFVEYCAGVVCKVHSLVIMERQDAESWLLTYENLRRELQQSYGKPDGQKTQLPAECEKTFADCVKSGKAWTVLRWRWDDGHAITLQIGTTRELSAISVSYAAPGAPHR